MAMQEYKIVNATQLDSDLAELASKYRDTFSISASTPLVFPESFIETVDNIEKRDSLTLVGKTITALAGYYKFDTNLTLSEDYVVVTDIRKNSNDMIFNNTDGIITAPAGYYSTDAIYTLPESYIDIEPLKKDSDDLTFVADTVIVPAGYYEVEAQYSIPAGYVDTTDITVTTFADATTIAAALPAGTQVTIPAGYYPDGIVITSSQVQETPAE